MESARVSLFTWKFAACNECYDLCSGSADTTVATRTSFMWLSQKDFHLSKVNAQVRNLWAGSCWIATRVCSCSLIYTLKWVWREDCCLETPTQLEERRFHCVALTTRLKEGRRWRRRLGFRTDEDPGCGSCASGRLHYFILATQTRLRPATLCLGLHNFGVSGFCPLLIFVEFVSDINVVWFMFHKHRVKGEVCWCTYLL